MKVIATGIEDVLLFEPVVHGDDRGYFMETWRLSIFREHGVDQEFVQDNQSSSTQGVLRGIHYQIRQPQGKLVRVISGRVFDVAVDLRRSSATFGEWVGAELTAENRQLLWVPPGFGHGFVVLSPEAEFVYKCTDYFAPEHERAIRFDDPELGIVWPDPPPGGFILSEKDRAGVAFADAELFD